jgi:hypothetical protein
MRAMSLEPPAAPPSAASATTVDEDSQEAENGRRLGRARKSVNYKEPSLNTYVLVEQSVPRGRVD